MTVLDDGLPLLTSLTLPGPRGHSYSRSRRPSNVTTASAGDNHQSSHQDYHTFYPTISDTTTPPDPLLTPSTHRAKDPVSPESPTPSRRLTTTSALSSGSRQEKLNDLAKLIAKIGGGADLIPLITLTIRFFVQLGTGEPIR